MLTPWLGIGLVLTVLVGMLLSLRALRHRCQWHPEVPRKLLHVGMGLVTLSFPWVFAATWPVWVLAGLAAVLLGAAKLLPPLRARLGGVVDSVERDSLGDLYFPISVALVFQLAFGHPVLYGIPILLLTLADAVAALIGVHYGHVQYATAGARKSAEGSLAFFTVAFFSTHVPLLLFTGTGRAETLLLGLTIGLLVMLIEAVAWSGLDNLLVPLGAYFLLVGYLPQHLLDLTTLLAATVGWVTFVFLLRRRSTLNAGALLAAALVGYLTWSVGGWAWIIPPLLLYLGYTILWPRDAQLREHPHTVHAVAAICAPALIWLAAARHTGQEALFYPYTVFYAAQLAFIGIAYYREVHRLVAAPPQLGWSAGSSWALIFLPFAFLQGLSQHTLLLAAFALPVILLATGLFNRCIPAPEHYSIAAFPWLRQAAIGALASAICLLPLYWKW